MSDCSLHYHLSFLFQNCKFLKYNYPLLYIFLYLSIDSTWSLSMNLFLIRTIHTIPSGPLTNPNDKIYPFRSFWSHHLIFNSSLTFLRLHRYLCWQLPDVESSDLHVPWVLELRWDGNSIQIHTRQDLKIFES